MMTINHSALPSPTDIYREVLPNGITILTRSNFQQPVGGYWRFFTAPARSSTPTRNSAWQTLSTSALMRGTKTRTFDTIYNELESAGASLGFSSGVHSSGFTGRSLAEDLPLLLNLLAGSLINPTFPRAESGKIANAIVDGSCDPRPGYV
jgi:zinc protease